MSALCRPSRPIGSFVALGLRKAISQVCGEHAITPRQLIEVAQGMDNLDTVPDPFDALIAELESMVR